MRYYYRKIRFTFNLKISAGQKVRHLLANSFEVSPNVKVHNNNQLYKSLAGDQLWNSGRQDWISSCIGDQEGAISDPAGVNLKGPVISHERYCLRMLSLNGLLTHLSKSCSTGVKPRGITATSIFRRCKSSLTGSVRWAWNESQTSNDCSAAGPLGRHAWIHSLTPRRNKKQN